MPDKDKKAPRHPEVTFLPPLEMVLAFFDGKAGTRSGKNEKPEASDEKTVEKLIEKLSEKETDE